MLRLERQIIGVVGPEGAGKSMLTKRLANDFRLPRVYPGDLLRELAASDTSELGEQARRMFQENAYFPPKMLIRVMRGRFSRGDLGRGFILDGSFRTTEETKDYPALLQETGLTMPVTIVSLRIPGWVSIERLATGSDARKRTDDTPDGVLRRLSHFYDELGLRSKAMRDNGWRILHLSTMADPETVYREMVNALSQEGN